MRPIRPGIVVVARAHDRFHPHSVCNLDCPIRMLHPVRTLRRLTVPPRAPLILASLCVLACSNDEDARFAGDRALAGTSGTMERVIDDSVRRTHQDSINRAQPGYIVDSILPPDEAWRRFLSDIPDPPRALTNGAATRDGLVDKWVRALERNDSLTVIRTAVNRPEFAALLYPSSPASRRPLYQPPGVLWGQLSSASLQGFRRSMERLGGKPLGFLSYRCAPEPERQGSNRLWHDCVIRRVRASGDTTTQRLFGSIVERDGQFKFYSLSSDM